MNVQVFRGVPWLSCSRRKSTLVSVVHYPSPLNKNTSKIKKTRSSHKI